MTLRGLKKNLYGDENMGIGNLHGSIRKPYAKSKKLGVWVRESSYLLSSSSKGCPVNFPG